MESLVFLWSWRSWPSIRWECQLQLVKKEKIEMQCTIVFVGMDNIFAATAHGFEFFFVLKSRDRQSSRVCGGAGDEPYDWDKTLILVQIYAKYGVVRSKSNMSNGCNVSESRSRQQLAASIYSYNWGDYRIYSTWNEIFFDVLALAARQQ